MVHVLFHCSSSKRPCRHNIFCRKAVPSGSSSLHFLSRHSRETALCGRLSLYGGFVLPSHRRSSHVAGFSSGTTGMSYSSRPTGGLRTPASGASGSFASAGELRERRRALLHLVCLLTRERLMPHSPEGQPQRLQDGLLQNSGQLTHGIVSHTLLRHWAVPGCRKRHVPTLSHLHGGPFRQQLQTRLTSCETGLGLTMARSMTNSAPTTEVSASPRKQ